MPRFNNLWLVILLLFPVALPGASYFVTVNGSDAAAGTEAAPWRTLQKGYNTAVEGDTIFFGPGDFAEWVTTASHGNSATTTNRIFLRPNATNTAITETRQIRVNHRFHTLDGIRVTKTIDIDPANQNASHIRVEAIATGTVLTNCWVTDTPLLSARFLFGNSGDQFILTATNSTVNFHSNHFLVGGHIFLGASSVSNGLENPSLKFYTNHDLAVRIAAMSADGQTIWVTNNAGTNFHTEPVQNLWATIFSGQGNGGYPGINMQIGSGSPPLGPTNCIIVNCIASNLTGAAIVMNGESNVYDGCFSTQMHGYYGAIFHGRHNIIENSVWKDSTNRIWMSSYEVATATHPPGGSFYDYDVGLIHSQASYDTNLLFRRNIIINFEQQLGVFAKEAAVQSGRFRVISNVFVGIKAQMSMNADYSTNSYNTYYRIFESSHGLAVGGPSSVNLQTNVEVAYNAFIDCGRDRTITTGWYSSTDTAGSNFVNNFVAGPESTGWHAKVPLAANPIAVNGGDPVLFNPFDPLGPDGLPFTNDDGLRPLPSSPLARNGIGAYTPVVVSAGTPIAHLSLASPTNWIDYTYTNFNPAWLTVEAPDRMHVVRPYTVPDPIANVPGLVKFTATNSIGGLDASSTNHAGIVGYGWDFGDGYRRLMTTNGEAWHTFGRTGEVSVTVWVTNSLGGVDSAQTTYRILPFTNFNGRVWYVSTNGNDTTGTGTNENLPYLTLAKAETQVAASNYVIVTQGLYTNEVLDVNRNVATTTGRITYLGYGARIAGFNIRHSDHTFDGFEVTGDGQGSFFKMFYIYEAADRLWIQNNYLHDIDAAISKMGVGMAAPASPYPADGPLSCVISNNIMDGIHYIQVEVHGSNHVVIDNWFANTGRVSGDDGDVFHPFGSNHLFKRNYATNFNGGHGDWAQAFGPIYWSKDITFEDNIAVGTTNFNGSALCQIEMDPSANYDYTNEINMTNWVLRNNQFINMALAGSVDIAGTKWYNNLFYLCNTSSGSPLVFGGPKGSSYGTVIKNNAFVGCGNGTASGWYPRTNDQPGITWNWNLDANNNFVAKANFTAYPQAPPNAAGSFKSDGQDANGVNGGDPKFVSAAAFNFHLLSGSPLTDAGTIISGFSADAEGISRPQGSAWDIGPYEWAGALVPPPPQTNFGGVHLQ